MSPAHRRYLLLEQGIGAGVVNFLINALIAWLSFRGQARVPLWGQQSIAGDTIATCLLLPLITCLIVTAVARRQMRSGRLAALGWTPVSHPPLGWLPRGTFVRGLAFGIVCVLVVAPPAVLTLARLGIEEMTFAQFVVFKATFAAALGAIVTPIIALSAIAEPLPEARARPS